MSAPRGGREALCVFPAPLLATILFHLGLWNAAWLLIEAGLMVLSSKVGKLRERDRIVNSLVWRGDERVLDVGCGRGLMLIGAAKKLRIGKAIGVDIWQGMDQSDNRPEATRKNARLEGVADRVEIESADARRLPFPDNSFDVVVSNLALHNIRSESERRKALQEIARVLKPGGHVAILDIAHTGQYMKAFQDSGLIDIHRSGLRFLIFPPVRLVTARKPMILVSREDEP